jgi:hypothetical protein
MMHTQPRLFRRPVALAAALVMAAALTAVPATAEPVSTGTAPSAGVGFVTGSTVLVLDSRTPATEVLIQATPPESFCYVGVAWPAAIDAGWKATATWSLDCRSRANPQLPAPDIFSILMDVRIYQGEFTPWDKGREVAHTSCSSGGPKRSCPTTTQESMLFGAPYYTTLDVKVALTGGTNPEGSFYTDPIRRS